MHVCHFTVGQEAPVADTVDKDQQAFPVLQHEESVEVAVELNPDPASDLQHQTHMEPVQTHPLDYSRVDVKPRLDILLSFEEVKETAVESDNLSVKSATSCVFRPWEINQPVEAPVQVSENVPESRIYDSEETVNAMEDNENKSFISTAEIVKTRKRSCTKPRSSPQKTKSGKKSRLYKGRMW